MSDRNPQPICPNYTNGQHIFGLDDKCGCGFQLAARTPAETTRDLPPLDVEKLLSMPNCATFNVHGVGVCVQQAAAISAVSRALAAGRSPVPHDLRTCPAMRALERLTPGGSEFVDDIERCVENVKETRHSLMNALKRAKGIAAPADPAPPQGQTPPAKWVIWSKYGYYWKADSRGYTSRIEEAGRYTDEEADRICKIRELVPGVPMEEKQIAPEFDETARRAEPAPMSRPVEPSEDDIQDIIHSIHELARCTSSSREGKEISRLVREAAATR